MTTIYREFRLQLKSLQTGRAIIDAGGVVQVCQAGLPDKQTIYADANGGALANPLVPTRGFINFFTTSDVASVDLYILSPGGHFVTLASVVASGDNEVLVNTTARRQVAKIPFSIADSVANTEKDTGFVLPSSAFVLNRLHGCGLSVVVADSTHTITVGTLSSQSGGAASGFINGSSVGTAGLVIGTDGASFSTNAPFATDSVTAKNVSYTLNTGTTLAKGFILLPYSLA